MEGRLKELGDPSGQQSAEYWDEWFNVVCGKDHQPFEWYCDVSEVSRILHSFPTESSIDAPRMIHPGSGNSLVPVKLRNDCEFPHEHTVVDISSVALEEMKTVHDLNSSEANRTHYLLGNVLEPPLPLKDNSFDVWVDKGLVDALFKEIREPYSSQAFSLFSEAYRILRTESSVVLVVTMAEKHSMEIILTNFWREVTRNLASLHIWELVPVSGDMRPFGFVLHRGSTSEGDLVIHWHSVDDKVSSITLHEKTFEHLLAKVSSCCEESRSSFRQAHQQDQTLATLEIKPWDADTDMNQVKEILVSTSWTAPTSDGLNRILKPIWCLDQSQVVPIGYGVSKLVLQCIVNSADLDDLVDAINEWEGDSKIEDGVQSVDIDWSQTQMIASLPSLAFPRSRESST